MTHEIHQRVVGTYEIAGQPWARLQCGHAGYPAEVGTTQRCRKCEAAREADTNGYAPRMAPVIGRGVR